MWILILFAHVGPLGDGNSNALTTATFETQTLCREAGQTARLLMQGTVKKIEFACVKAKEKA